MDGFNWTDVVWVTNASDSSRYFLHWAANFFHRNEGSRRKTLEIYAAKVAPQTNDDTSHTWVTELKKLFLAGSATKDAL